MKKLITYFYPVLALAMICGTKLFATDTWERINSPQNNVAYSLYSNENGILLMGSGQGINWSSDRGENWTPSESENSMAHLIMAFAEDSKGTLYAGGAEGLFRSTDEGQYWDLIKKTRMAEIIEIDEEDNLYLVTFIKDGFPKLLVSSNSGQSWKDRTPSYDTSWTFRFKVIKSDLIIASIDSGLLISKDKGTTWEEASGIGDSIHITCIAEADSKIIANSFYDDKNTGIFQSTDGSEWERLSTSPDSLDITQITYNPHLKEHYAVKWSRGVLRSSDNGITWTDFGQGLPSNEYVSQITPSADGYIYASGSMKLYRRKTNADATNEPVYSPDDIVITPNPAHESFRIELPSCFSTPIQVEIYDVHGRRIQSPDFNRITDTKIESGLLNISPGYYFLKIHTDGRAFVKPLIIKSK